MEKIAIIGSSGSGKSTLARKLGQLTALPVHHLDVLHWKPNWELTSKNEQVKIQEELVRQSQWIIDGNYAGTMDIRLDACDTVIFLDFPRSLCLYRVIKRAYQYRNKQRPDMREGNKEHIDIDFYKWIWHFPRDKRPEIVKRLEILAHDKEVIWLHTPKEVESFLNRLKEEDEHK